MDSELKSVTLTGMIVMLKLCAGNLGCCTVGQHKVSILKPQSPYDSPTIRLFIHFLQQVLEQQAEMCLEKDM